MVGAENIQVMRDLHKTYFDQPVIAGPPGRSNLSSVIGQAERAGSIMFL